MRTRIWGVVGISWTVVMGITLYSVTGSARQDGPDPVGEPERVVQEQLDAYNRRDLDAFLATYAPGIKIYDFPDELRSTGLDPMRERYGALFDRAPDLNAEITERIVQGDHVIDHERVTAEGKQFSAVAIYQVEGGKIINVWFVR